MFNSAGCSQRKSRREVVRKSGGMKQTVEGGQGRRWVGDAIKQCDRRVLKVREGKKTRVSAQDMEEGSGEFSIKTRNVDGDRCTGSEVIAKVRKNCLTEALE